jgi:hypothetical protein
MEKNKEKALSIFVDEPEEVQDDTQAKEVVLHEREGLIERVDKKFVTNDGRQLLREHY